MSYETANPVAVVDVESDPQRVVTRYSSAKDAEWFIGYLAKHGGDVTAAKVARGGYAVVIEKS